MSGSSDDEQEALRDLHGAFAMTLSAALRLAKANAKMELPRAVLLPALWRLGARHHGWLSTNRPGVPALRRRVGREVPILSAHISGQCSAGFTVGDDSGDDDG